MSSAVPSPTLPTWDAVTLAQEALRRTTDLPAVDEAELYVHDSSEASTTLEPTTPCFTGVQGRVLAYGCRVWRDGLCASRARSVSGFDDLRALVAETARAPGTAMALSPVTRLAPTERGPEPGGLVMSEVEDLAVRTASAVGSTGAAVQAVITHRFQTLMGITTRSGTEAVQFLPAERVQVRCETPHGPVTDAVTQTSIGPEIDISGMVHRYTEAMDTLAGPGGAPPEGLPVLLRPTVAGPLAIGLVWLLSGATAADTPGLANAVGKRLFPSSLTVDDPGALPGEWMPTVDNEGHRAGPVSLVERGRLVGFLHSIRTAIALGHEPNGRGMRMGVPALPEPTPLRFRVASRQGTLPEDYLELNCRLDIMNPMPRTGQVELTAAGWEVRGGRRIRRVGPIELRCDILRYWRTLIATGDDATFIPGAAESVLPSLVFRGLP
jgi:PmbA protein